MGVPVERALTTCLTMDATTNRCRDRGKEWMSMTCGGVLSVRVTRRGLPSASSRRKIFLPSSSTFESLRYTAHQVPTPYIRLILFSSRIHPRKFPHVLGELLLSVRPSL